MTETKSNIFNFPKVKAPTEFIECKNFVQWANMQPNVGPFLIHIPNEGKRTKYSGHNLKLVGLKKGVPDYFLAVTTTQFHGLWIEMKRMGLENRKKCPDQDNWIKKLNEKGFMASYAYGWEHASQVIKDYLYAK